MVKKLNCMCMIAWFLPHQNKRLLLIDKSLQLKNKNVVLLIKSPLFLFFFVILTENLHIFFKNPWKSLVFYFIFIKFASDKQCFALNC